MKFVIDKSIPFIEGVFEPYASVLYREGPEISNDDLRDADALIIRTRTKCDEKLLDGSPVKIIATATAGTDNIDADYCRKRGIFVQNASGCNAGGVANYVFSALFGAAARKSISLTGATIGIIGLGSAGERVEAMGRSLGFKILRHDPRKAEIEWYTQFCPLDRLLRDADIVTLHVPLNESTKGMANADFFARMKPGAFFINLFGSEDEPEPLKPTSIELVSDSSFLGEGTIAQGTSSRLGFEIAYPKTGAYDQSVEITRLQGEECDYSLVYSSGNVQGNVLNSYVNVIGNNPGEYALKVEVADSVSYQYDFTVLECPAPSEYITGLLPQ